jgi:BirA family biotin operon repressor/biotin-[acetyl-CoA-carboxylase] ligase
MVVPICIPACASTNDEAWAGLEQGLYGHGQLIYTLHQSAGRGQRGTQWLAKPGQNLLCSTLLRVQGKVAACSLFDLSRMAALAIAEAVDLWTKTEISPQIKWPNDLIVKGKKLGGILIENRWAGPDPEWAVIGLGLNVNQTHFEPGLNATSLAVETGQRFSLEDGATLVQKSLTDGAGRLHHSASLQDRYQAKLYQYQQMGLFAKPDGTTFQALQLGTTEQGHLRLLANVTEHHFDIKEIRQLGPVPTPVS